MNCKEKNLLQILKGVTSQFRLDKPLSHKPYARKKLAPLKFCVGDAEISQLDVKNEVHDKAVAIKPVIANI